MTHHPVTHRPEPGRAAAVLTDGRPLTHQADIDATSRYATEPATGQFRR